MPHYSASEIVYKMCTSPARFPGMNLECLIISMGNAIIGRSGHSDTSISCFKYEYDILYIDIIAKSCRMLGFVNYLI